MINRIFVSVLVAAVAITLIVSAGARGKTALTDAEMTGVYGGGGGGGCPDRYYCVYAGQACADTEYQGNCAETGDPNWPGGPGSGCDGWWKTSCLQEQRTCEWDQGQSARHCDDWNDEDCAGTYSFVVCGYHNQECEPSYTNDLSCYGRTPGTKWWCYDW